MLSFFVLYITLNLLQLSYALCPTLCQCQSKTIYCETCLFSFYQTYNLSTNTCNCIKHFVEYDGGQGTCCPENCQICYKRGCAACKPHATTVWNNTYKYYACICNQNYFLNNTECNCLSQQQPIQYYQNSEKGTCQKCPKSCNCSEKGCYQCALEVNRKIKEVRGGKMVCECIIPYRQNSDGECVCPHHCTCINQTIINCDEQAKRIYTYKSWPCQQPYIELNGTCVCLEPFALMEVYGKLQCLCKSKLNYNNYYQVDKKCRQCADQCTCDNKGCSSCVGIFRLVQSFQCKCIPKAKEINNQCACVSPYYSNQQGKCACLSHLYPQKYYQSFRPNECYLCPRGCKCSAYKGCYFCQNYTHRKVEEYVYDLSSGKKIFYCGCAWHLNQVNSQCVCPPQKKYHPETDSCQCSNQESYVVSASNYYCYLCPQLCQCNHLGCHYCHPSALRKITLRTFDNGQIKFTCYCNDSLYQVDNICRCNFDQIFNQTLNRCDCDQLHYVTANFEQRLVLCDCRFYVDSENFYLDLSGTRMNNCIRCPKGCTCDGSGCYDCEKYTMRFVDFAEQLWPETYVRCPCYQNAVQIDGKCTICLNNSYFNGYTCVYCLTCQTCDAYGCLSCYQSMTLNNKTCVCNDQELDNIEGKCLCPFGKYLNINSSEDNLKICSTCPEYCLTCKQDRHKIICLSCSSSGTHRLNQPLNNCPCQHGYVEQNINKRICCDMYCAECNQIECLACPKFSFRTLINGTCQCLKPYGEILASSQINMLGEDNIDRTVEMVCSCPFGTYYNNQSCLDCPPNCKQCQYNLQSKQIACKSCRQSSNRNTSSYICQCLPGFRQSIPRRGYCYANFCQNIQNNCSKCSSDRLLDSNGLCVCSQGQFDNNGICLPCVFQGCLNCESKTLCNQCDQANGYYLSANICFHLSQPTYLISQTIKNNFVLQIQLDTPFSLKNISSFIYEINSTSSTDLVNLQIISADITQQNTLIVIMTNPEQSYYNVIVSLLLSNQGTENRSKKVVNVKIQHILSQQQLLKYDNSPLKAIKQVTIIFIFAALFLSTLGYKHNQIMFYLQSMCMIGLFLSQQSLHSSLALYNLSYSILQFNTNNFYNVIPNNYLESSLGNFKYLMMDSNIFRIIQILLIVQTVTIIILIMLIISVNCILYVLNIHAVFTQFKKKIFRIFEFFFKICLYPLNFFSVNTLLNSSCLVYVEKQFRTTSIIVSIFIILIHFLVILYLNWFGRLSRLNKLQLISLFSLSIITPIVIILTIKISCLWVVSISLIFILKDIFYLQFRQRIVSKNKSFKQLILVFIFSYEIIGTTIQIIAPILIYLGNPVGGVVMIIVTASIQVLVQVLVAYRASKNLKFQKIQVFHAEKFPISVESSKGIIQL